MKFVFSKKRRKENGTVALTDWKLGFRIEEKEAGAELLVKRLLKAKSDDRHSVFSLPTKCHLFGSNRMTSPVRKIKLIHMDKNPVRVFGTNSRLVMKALTENMHMYILLEPYMSEEMREVLINAGFPKEYLSSVAARD